MNSNPDTLTAVIADLTQRRLAEFIAEHYADRLMHVHGIGWYCYPKGRGVWREDQLGKTTQAVIGALEDVRKRLADTLPDPSDREGMKAFNTAMAALRALNTSNAIEGVKRIAAAMPELAYLADDLDTDPNILNVDNGTLDLRTLELRSATALDRCTHVTRGAYHPEQPISRVWLDFVERVLPDADVRGYLQRLCGVALYGSVRAQLLPILTGTGANGKSVFVEALMWALGDYAVAAEPNMLLSTSESAHTTGLTNLMGARFATTQETNEGRKLDAAMMKRLTGGDAITARKMRQDNITFYPSHLLMMVTNHLPTVRGDDDAVWRRLKVIPFDVVIPADERDPELGMKLQACASDVLAWAIEGLKAYQSDGLVEPAAVRRASAEYHAESDDIERFLSDECLRSDALDEYGNVIHVGASELYGEYVRWERLQGNFGPMSNTAFGRKLVTKGLRRRKTSSGNRYEGVCMKVQYGS